jgi:hypothetical protein
MLTIIVVKESLDRGAEPMDSPRRVRRLRHKWTDTTVIELTLYPVEAFLLF